MKKENIIKTEWDLTYLYKNDEAWKKDFEELISMISILKEKITSLKVDEKTLIDVIEYDSLCNRMVEKLYCYARRHLDIDSTLKSYEEMMNKALELYNELQLIGVELENFIIENKLEIKKLLKDANFSKYKRYIELILRKSGHIIDDENAKEKIKKYTDKIFALKKRYQEIVNGIDFKTVNVDGEEVKLNRDNYNDLISHKTPEVRQTVYNQYMEAYKEVGDKIARAFLDRMQNDIDFARFQKYNSLLEKKMFEAELPKDIIKSLIEKVNDNLDFMHEYTSLKSELIGLDEFHMYDSSVSICDIPKIEYSLMDAINIIKSALSVLGEDYVALIDKMFTDGWIDVYPKDNKRKMSFSCLSYDGVPYVLVNYNGSISSVRTLAHEIGHSINTELTKNRNSFTYFDISFFLTEIASKVNEMLFNDYMLHHAESLEEKKYILNSIIGSMGSSIFGQVMLTEFEDTIRVRLESGENITFEDLNELYISLSKKYNGNAVTYEELDIYAYLKIPHFVMQDSYYLYQYSVGTAIALDIASRILSGEEGLVERYKECLSFGKSKSLDEVLKTVGVDLASGNYMDKAISYLKDKMAEFKNLYTIKK